MSQCAEVFTDLDSVQAVLRAAHDSENCADVHGCYGLRAMLRELPVTEYRVSYLGVVLRVLCTDSGLPICIDHYSGRGRKRGGLILAGPRAYKPVTIAGVGLPYSEDSWPTGGQKFIDSSRAVLAAFWSGLPVYDVMAVLGQHSGHCAVCGACLSLPESKERGIGPECIKKPGVQAWYHASLAAGTRPKGDWLTMLFGILPEVPARSA